MQNKKVVGLGIGVILFVVAFSIGCVGSNNSEPVSPIDYGNGVYYFDGVRGERFASSLSAFIQAHPDFEMMAMTGDSGSGYGRDFGYFVVFKIPA